MKKLRNKKLLLILADLLLIPALVFCRYLSQQMLATETECSWARFGGKCVSCGGTHFVNTLLSGQIGEAFSHNWFFFLLTVFFAVSFLLLNLWLLFGLPFAEKALKRLYNYYMLLFGLAVMLIFFFLRNGPVFLRLFQALSALFSPT